MKGIYALIGFAILAVLATALTFGIGAIGVGLWLALVFVGAPARADKARASLKSVLMADEEIVAEAIQHRVFALLHRRSVLAITSSRVVYISRGLFGGFRMADIQWKDLLDARIEQNVLGDMCGSNLSFTHLNRQAPAIGILGVPSKQASAMYSRAQAEEQAWEEKRRVRGMEQLRAASGGVHINAGPGGAAPSGAGGGTRIADEIAKAKALFDSGAVSDAEFQEMKAKILAG